MTLTTMELQEQLRTIDEMVMELKRGAGARVADAPAYETTRIRYEVLKAVAADLRARLDLPRSLALGEIERAIGKMTASKTRLGYDQGKMMHVTSVLVQHWPFVRQALEHYGEASAE